MRIESALISSQQGLDAHGKAIAVIGDNVANSNTVGYKASRTEFRDMLSIGPDGVDTAKLPASGSGAAIQRVRQLWEGGSLDETGRALDVAVDGNGFFMVQDSSGVYLTRAGNFQIDQSGYLVNSTGKQVLGFPSGSTTLGAIDMINLNTSGAPTTQAAINGGDHAAGRGVLYGVGESRRVCRGSGCQ
jgi:flagellar hook protein FlgE